MYSAGIPVVYSPGMKYSPKQVSNWASFIADINAQYPISQLTFPAPTVWPSDPINIQKRQLACPPTPTPTQPSKPSISSPTNPPICNNGNADSPGCSLPPPGGIPFPQTNSPQPSKPSDDPPVGGSGQAQGPQNSPSVANPNSFVAKYPIPSMVRSSGTPNPLVQITIPCEWDGDCVGLQCTNGLHGICMPADRQMNEQV